MAAAAAPAVRADVAFAPAAGVFQYYDAAAAPDLQPFAVSVRAGFAAGAAARWERETTAWEFDGRYRDYRGEAFWGGAEARAAYYFHPTPARPYVAPAVGFARAGENGASADFGTLGVRVGGVLVAAGRPLTVDVFGDYRALVKLGRDGLRPAFSSELGAGGRCWWKPTAHLGLFVEAGVTWPGYFADRHESPTGADVLPYVLAGPALGL